MPRVGLSSHINELKTIAHRYAHRPTQGRQCLIKSLFPGDTVVPSSGLKLTITDMWETEFQLIPSTMDNHFNFFSMSSLLIFHHLPTLDLFCASVLYLCLNTIFKLFILFHVCVLPACTCVYLCVCM